MRKALTRWGSRVSAASLLAAVAAVAGSAPARAHHPEVTASVRCDGLVRFTATAWSGFPDDPDTAADETKLSRTNEEITVSVSTNGGRTFLELNGSPDYAFTPGNNYAFSDTFQLPEPLPPTVIVRARAARPWANAEGVGAPRQTPPIQVPRCDAGQQPGQTGPAAPGDGGQDGTGPAGDRGQQQPGQEQQGQGQGQQGQGGQELAAARAPGVREVGPAGFAMAAAGLIVLVTGLIAAGLWARRRIIES